MIVSTPNYHNGSVLRITARQLPCTSQSSAKIGQVIKDSTFIAALTNERMVSDGQAR
jgi:hypothetical protein